MKVKLKLRSNRKGAGILGVVRTGLCREVTNVTREVLGPKRALPRQFCESAPFRGAFLF